MKKTVILLLSLLTLLCLAACGAGTDTVPTTQACQHNYSSQITEEASCTSDGICIHTCTLCGDSYTEIIDKIGHDYTATVTVEPTCAVEGTKTLTCKACGDSYTEAIATVAHEYSDTITTAPTCTTEGVKTFTCNSCGAMKTEPVEKTAHNYSGKVTTKPTCTSEGVKTLTCKDCGHTTTEVVSKKPHDYASKVTTQPTCTAKGVKTFTCKDCDDSYTEPVNKVPHDYSASITKAATCTAEGVRTFSCKDCGDSYTESVEKIPHEYTSAVTKAATCTAEGVTTFSCKACDHSYTESIAMIPHAYSGQVTKAATCTAEGVMTFTCGGCGDSYTETIAMEAHSYTSQITTEVTCLADGVRTYTCIGCGDSYTEVIPTSGHDTDSNYLCRNCGKVIPDMTEEEKEIAKQVSYITNSEIRYLEEEGRFALTFAFNKYNNGLVVPAVVDIYIENENGTVVYKATRVLKSSDYMDWSSGYSTYRNQATIFISVDEIAPDMKSSGRIYFKVYNEGYFDLSEESLYLSNLPLKPVTINLPEMPMLYYRYYDNGKWGDALHSVTYLSEIHYEVKNDDLYIYFSGMLVEMYFNSYHAEVAWELWDSNGKVVCDGIFRTISYLDSGEYFTDEYDVAENCIVPGETYTLVIVEK